MITVAELMQSVPLVLPLQAPCGCRSRSPGSRTARALVPLRSTAVTTRRPMMRRGPVMPPACWRASEAPVPPRTAASCLRSGLPRAPCLSTSRSSIRSWRRRGSAMALRSEGLVEAWRKGSTAVRSRRASRSDRRDGRRLRHPPGVVGRGASPPGHGLVQQRGGWARGGAASVRMVGCGAAGDRCLRAAYVHEARHDRRRRSDCHARPVRREPTAGGKGRRASPPSGDARAGAAGFAVGGSRSLPYRLAGRGPGRRSGSELPVGGVGERGSCAGARARGLRDGVGALCCARWWSGGPGAGDRRCAEVRAMVTKSYPRAA